MMTFEQMDTDYIAINSIKPVLIALCRDGTYMIHTPQGRLLDSFISAGPFVDFEGAKRNAEMNVGMKMNWEDF